MEKIRNVIVEKSYRQQQDFLIALKSKKRAALRNTDWTQLGDVHVKNADGIRAWRQRLRYFVIDESANAATEDKLDKLISEMPEMELMEL